MRRRKRWRMGDISLHYANEPQKHQSRHLINRHTQVPSGNAFHFRNDPNAKNINGGKESAQWWSSFISLSWKVQVSLLCSAGEADLESAMLTDLTNWLRRPALSLAAIWTLLLCWQREHHWADCCPLWITALSTTSWMDGASKRLVQLHCHKDRYRKSFLAKSITLYNSSLLVSPSHLIPLCLFNDWNKYSLTDCIA